MTGASENIKTGWKDYWAGLHNGLAPMLGKEMRTRTRGRRAPILLSVYLGLLSAGTAAFLWLYFETIGSETYNAGLNLYETLVFGLVLLLSFVAPAVAASAISGERERRTYDLLLVTKASLTGIVLGKWLASVVYMLFLILAALPILSVVYLFGGVPPANIFMVVLLCIIIGLGYGALGLCISAVLRRSQAATIVSLVLVFVLVFGTPIVAGIVVSGNDYDDEFNPYSSYEAGYHSPGIPWYTFTSPLLALIDVMPGGDSRPGHGIPLISSVMNELMHEIMPREMDGPSYMFGISEAKNKGLASWPFWARFALNQAGLVLVSLSIAVLAIMPRKPWHAWRVPKRDIGS